MTTRHSRSRWTHAPLALALGLFGAVLLQALLSAQPRGGPGGGPQTPVASLRGVPVPVPEDLGRYVRDPQALVALGKALFWDVQVGSDGRTACATCHFHAGADHRRQNVLASPHDVAYPVTPNQALRLTDFPFRALANPNDNNSAVTRDVRLIVGSPGVVARTFVDVIPGDATEDAVDTSSTTPFAIGGLKVRQVTARNAPTVINAVFNVRNFWDGRASDVFTGATPFGDADQAAHMLVVSGSTVVPERVRLTRASLASQAVGPVLNAVEMSFGGRSWPLVARKLLSVRPLGQQDVAADDSVLGAMARTGATGLRDEYGYAALIRQAFRPEFWNASIVVDASGRVQDGVTSPRNTDEFTVMEFNFAVFWGLAIQAYEATLVSDDSRVDRFLAGDTGALSAQEQQGLQEFQGGGSQCTRCHGGAETTQAAYSSVARAGFDVGVAGAFGFFRTGVSVVSEDGGAAGRDDFGLPLFPAAGGTAVGAFKSPTLRNVEFTGPYFHTGGSATLEQVVEFYVRNGDFPEGGNLGPGIGTIRIGPQDRASLVAFMKALSDDRVAFERAPFDHPSLCVPVGYEQVAGTVAADTAARGPVAADSWALVPAIGRDGNPVRLQTFDELLAGIGADGSRAHTMTTPCTVR